MNSITYITLEEAIAKHDEIILASGGLLGLRDEGLLISALTMIQNDFYYSEYHEKLTHLIFSINKNHCFNDGNKRASVGLGAIFLMKNGWTNEFIEFFIKKMEIVSVWLAEKKIGIEELKVFIALLINDLKENNDYKDHSTFIDEINALLKI
ncbi:type II toxin-antitoxin system death-on-curing family toxin [Snodgrassella alvi]|uniref:type II toxin-antitoxin system death-on-curing family toxin n=1 Tax=Snodgrassella alvi TaxID=1196083 RepID=UPI003D072F6F